MERHRYGRHPEQYGELHMPAGADAPAPVAVLIHGGFWQARYDLRLMDDLAEDLALRGWAAWNLEYRRLGNGGGYPMTFDDVARGTDWLARWGTRLDLERVVSIGHSAGGHLAVWFAVWAAQREAPDVRLAGLVAQAGVLDLEPGMGDGAVLELLGGRPDEVPERYAAASPARRLPVGVAVLLTHGADDRAVPPQQSIEFAAAARAAGDAVELAVVPGEAHMAHLDPGSGLWRAVVDWLERLPAGRRPPRGGE